MRSHDSSRPHNKRKPKENELWGKCGGHTEAYDAHSTHCDCGPGLWIVTMRCLSRSLIMMSWCQPEPWRTSAWAARCGLSSGCGDTCPPWGGDPPSGKVDFWKKLKSPAWKCLLSKTFKIENPPDRTPGTSCWQRPPGCLGAKKGKIKQYHPSQPWRQAAEFWFQHFPNLRVGQTSKFLFSKLIGCPRENFGRCELVTNSSWLSVHENLDIFSCGCFFLFFVECCMPTPHYLTIGTKRWSGQERLRVALPSADLPWQYQQVVFANGIEVPIKVQH